jgi:hypothetical protein
VTHSDMRMVVLCLNFPSASCASNEGKKRRTKAEAKNAKPVSGLN